MLWEILLQVVYVLLISCFAIVGKDFVRKGKVVSSICVLIYLGIATTEQLLSVDTNVTAVGQLIARGDKFRLMTTLDKKNFPYILSTYPLERKSLHSHRGLGFPNCWELGLAHRS